MSVRSVISSSATLMSVMFLFSAAPAAAQSIEFTGTCPGSMTVNIEGLTPGGDFVVLAGDGAGTMALTASPCPDAEASFSSLARKFGPMTDGGGTGSVTVTPTVAGWACDLSFQVLDLTTCEISEPATLEAAVFEGFIYAGDGRTGGFSGAGIASGLHLLDLAGGTTTMVGGMGVGVTGLSYGPDGLLYGVESNGRNYPGILTMDPLDGSQSFLSESSDIGSMSAFAWADGVLYGWTEATDELNIIDPLTGDVRLLGYTTSTLHNCFATDDSEQLFLVNNGTVSVVDPLTPSVTVLGLVSGMTAMNGTGCTFHEGDLYVATGLPKRLYRVDLPTLTATDMGISLSEDIDALASPTP